MAKIGTFSKQPAEVLDYDVNYDGWLLDVDELSQADVVIAQTRGASPTLALDSKQVGTRAVKMWFSGGADADQYVIAVTATTVGGRVKEDEFTMNIKEI